MIIEEPDIEIGAGVSSKAISQKIHLRVKQDSGSRGRGRGREEKNWNNQRDEGGFQQGNSGGGGIPVGFPPFPMMQGTTGDVSSRAVSSVYDAASDAGFLSATVWGWSSGPAGSGRVFWWVF